MHNNFSYSDLRSLLAADRLECGENVLGQVSMQRAVLSVKKNGKRYSESVASFVEEDVVRRELSDNFCYYNKNYDSVKGATDWAQKTLKDHKNDKREYVLVHQTAAGGGKDS